jgi:MFS family permease
VGAIVACVLAGPICNIIGRKNTIIISALVKFVGIILMSAAQNFGMFIAGRIILGFGSGISGTATPT